MNLQRLTALVGVYICRANAQQKHETPPLLLLPSTSPHALTHLASSKLVVVNEAADICGAVQALQLPGGHLTRPGQPHAGTTCAAACRGVDWEGLVLG